MRDTVVALNAIQCEMRFKHYTTGRSWNNGALNSWSPFWTRFDHFWLLKRAITIYHQSPWVSAFRSLDFKWWKRTHRHLHRASSGPITASNCTTSPTLNIFLKRDGSYGHIVCQTSVCQTFVCPNNLSHFRFPSRSLRSMTPAPRFFSIVSFRK